MILVKTGLDGENSLPPTCFSKKLTTSYSKNRISPMTYTSYSKIDILQADRLSSPPPFLSAIRQLALTTVAIKTRSRKR